MQPYSVTDTSFFLVSEGYKLSRSLKTILLADELRVVKHMCLCLTEIGLVNQLDIDFPFATVESREERQSQIKQLGIYNTYSVITKINSTVNEFLRLKENVQFAKLVFPIIRALNNRAMCEKNVRFSKSIQGLARTISNYCNKSFHRMESYV